MWFWRLASPPTICRVAWRLEIQGRADVAVQVWRWSAGRISFFSQGEVGPFLLKPSSDWRRPTHILQANCFIQSLLTSMLLLSQNTLTETSSITFNQIPGYCNPPKLAQKTNQAQELVSFAAVACCMVPQDLKRPWDFSSFEHRPPEKWM